VTGHTVDELISRSGWAAPAYPLLVVGILFFIFIVMGSWLNNLFRRACPSLDFEQPTEDDEDLDTYWNSLSAKDRDWSIQEEEYFRGKTQGNQMVDDNGRVLELPIMLDSQLQALKDSVGKGNPNKSIQGCHTYDILANPSYFDDFQYVPVCTGDPSKKITRADIIKDDDMDEGNDNWVSDKVRVGLNLAFINLKEAKAFDISKKKLEFPVDEFLKDLGGLLQKRGFENLI